SWTDWRWQISQAVRTVEQLKRLVEISKTRAEEIAEVLQPRENGIVDEMRLTPFLVSLINWDDPQDPIARQHLPSKSELAEDVFSLDTIWEKSEDFADGANRMIQQKYPDIILLRLSNTCHSYCRFCFQKERTLQSSVSTKTGEEEFNQALEIIRNKSEVRQVLISGGDPLILTDEILLDRLQKLAAIPHISTLRLNTRVLLHNPFRVTPELATQFKTLTENSWNKNRERGIELKIGVHFNHPAELTPEALNAIRLLQKNGIQVYNQSVLLKGINDRVEVLTELFRQLRQENIDLHYLSVAMTVPGTSHFRTSVRAAQEIMTELNQTKEFRGQLPHLEMSHHTGKQIVPTNMTDSFFETEINGKPVIKFLSDITGQWEYFFDCR
ncbi:MAG: KamA family radical SAM protein, partial [Candidatus Magasanikbacteria bacterium]|nr:KamA family radical SAM protein [Candidatus Magasanikbacteria bacterium]